MSNLFNAEDKNNLNNLASLVRQMNTLGHNPATSGNYSLRSSIDPEIAYVSESGIDKSQFHEDHFLPLIIQSKKMHSDYINSGRKSSDETDIHLSIYQITDAKCVLHSHILEAILFAELFPNTPYAQIKGLELLKVFRGIKTHDTQINIPCFNNTQDIAQLSEEIKPAILNDLNNYGLILRGHGIYVWGKSVEEAKRHLEAFVYIFKYYLNFPRGL